MLVPLVDEALDVARAVRGRVESGFAFATVNGTPVSYRGFNGPFGPWRHVLGVAKQLGFTTVRTDGREYDVRDMRALGVTSMLRAGLAVPVICKVTGHSPDMVARYARLSVDDAKKAIRIMHGGKQSKVNSAERFRALVEEKFKTRVAAAEALGVSRQTLHNWLEGTVDFESLPVARVREIAEVLGTDLEGLGVR